MGLTNPPCICSISIDSECIPLFLLLVSVILYLCYRTGVLFFFHLTRTSLLTGTIVVFDSLISG